MKQRSETLGRLDSRQRDTIPVSSSCSAYRGYPLAVAGRHGNKGPSRALVRLPPNKTMSSHVSLRLSRRSARARCIYTKHNLAVLGK
ncbi:hypothetical protein AAFF_G00135750 [Aldrovandia affinis]|uniref:Uncharacterized protein n=1 Tax=Aldrovandia affinis TaxID=143900 RepID=A0AAD7RQ11_9TELE|nr:hypothetical protein AAFF_G00135750 [Aldrovandia affinis]